MLPLSKDMDSATDSDLFDYMVQHGIKGWEHLSEYEMLEDWQEDVDDWGEQWQRFAEDWLVYRFESFTKDFQRIAKFENGKIKVYRCIETEDPDVNALGIYWSWDIGSARCYWGDRKGSETDITALVDISDINLENTFYKNLHPITGGEAEIELKPGVEIEVIEVDDEEKSFTAKANVSGGVEDTDYPYYHVSDHPETPTLVKSPDTIHNDPGFDWQVQDWLKEVWGDGEHLRSVSVSKTKNNMKNTLKKMKENGCIGQGSG